jgi:hypothetical protein
MVNKSEELELTNQIVNLMTKFDMTAFTIKFWKIIIDELKNGLIKLNYKIKFEFVQQKRMKK